MSRRNHEEIQSALSAVLRILEGVFTKEEAGEVRHFADVNEYGLALQTAVDIVLEKNKCLPEEALRAMQRLADLMGGV